MTGCSSPSADTYNLGSQCHFDEQSSQLELGSSLGQDSSNPHQQLSCVYKMLKCSAGSKRALTVKSFSGITLHYHLSL